MVRSGTSCTVEGCDRAAWARGLCNTHYTRWWKHGDPIKLLKRENGEAERYLLDTVMSYEGDECLIWPFNRNTHGYATVGVHGRRRIVSRMVCQMGRGEPPSPDHEAAHSCGHGAEGCVAKRHLSWKTHTANEHDKVEHGTVNRGTRNGGAKITEADARMVLTLSTDGLSQRKIAERFGISQGTVSKIVRGEKWGWIVTPEPSP